MGPDEYAWHSLIEISNKSPREAKILLRDVPYPFIGQDEIGYVAYVPRLKIDQNGYVEYQDMSFGLADKDLRLMAWSVFRSSITYLCSFIAVSDPSIYSDFLKERNEQICLTALSLVEHASVHAFMKTNQQLLLPEIALADALARRLLKPINLIRDPGLRFSFAVLTQYEIGSIEGNISEKFAGDTEQAAQILRDLEKKLIRVYESDKKGDHKEEQPNGFHAPKLNAIQEIYDSLSSYRFRVNEIPSLPYMNHLDPPTTLHALRMARWKDVEPLFQEIAEKWGLNASHTSELLADESLQILSSWVMDEKTEDKILEKYQIVGKETRFRGFMFPEEDYAEFVRRREKHSKPVGRLVNRLAVVYNASGEDYRQETGGLDLQEAIQVVASRSDRTDVFTDESLMYRSQAWAILVDVSQSLNAFSGEVKDILLCLTEAAKRLFQDNHSLGIYAFDDKFYVVKDFSETYTNKVCARMGGLKNGGLTYLPD
ncbi:hypothetical protein MUP37_06355, partial [Candidatus Bathyarchaeota archaeon]|nr:hypothetical protein [Candidatus Bathyarchaeota archaeon]